MFSSFADKTTDSLNKYVNDAYLEDILESVKNHLEGSVCVMLVGNAEGMARQIEYAQKFVKEIYVPERDLATHLGQRKFIKRKKYKNVFLLKEDFFKVVEDLIKKGKKIGILDFDGTEVIGKNEQKLYALAKRANIPIITNVGATRGQSVSFKVWCKKNKKRKTKRGKCKAYELARLGLCYVNSIFKGYENEFCTYMGQSNMYMAISIKRGLK